MSKQIFLNGLLIGTVYKSTHGLWVAQPAWANYSCTFSTQECAEIELMLHAANQGKQEEQYIQ